MSLRTGSCPEGELPEWTRKFGGLSPRPQREKRDEDYFARHMYSKPELPEPTEPVPGTGAGKRTLEKVARRSPRLARPLSSVEPRPEAPGLSPDARHAYNVWCGEERNRKTAAAGGEGLRKPAPSPGRGTVPGTGAISKWSQDLQRLREEQVWLRQKHDAAYLLSPRDSMSLTRSAAGTAGSPPRDPLQGTYRAVVPARSGSPSRETPPKAYTDPYRAGSPFPNPELAEEGFLTPGTEREWISPVVACPSPVQVAEQLLTKYDILHGPAWLRSPGNSRAYTDVIYWESPVDQAPRFKLGSWSAKSTGGTPEASSRSSS